MYEWLMILTVVLASFADLVTTELALSTVPNAMEGNPLLRNQKIRIPVKIITPVIFNYTLEKLEKKKKIKRWHRVVTTIIVSSIWGYLAYRNNEIYKRRH